MWRLDQISRRYNCRPSDLFDIRGGYEAFCFDELIFTFCSFVERKIDEVPEGKGKGAAKKRQRAQDQLFRQLLQLGDSEVKGRQFKDPMSMIKPSEGG